MLTLSELAANTAADAIGRLLDGGRLQIIGPDALLAVLSFPQPAFEPASNGSAPARDLADGEGLQDGAAQRFVATTAEGQPVLSGNVGQDFELSTVVTKGAPVQVRSLKLVIGGN